MNDRARILVADDEHNLCRILVARLTRDGYHAEAVHDGAQALARVTAEPHDLLILDMRMPILGGLEVLQEVRHRSLEIAVIVMTACDGPDALRAAMAAGADAYLGKPFDLNVVGAVVRETLARRRGAAP